MKRFRLAAAVFVLIGGCVSFARAAGSGPTFINVIEGTVYDTHHAAIPDLWVELQNEINSTYGRVRTSNAGRFQFTGMRPGRYVLKVYTTGTEFQEQSESVEVVNVVASASDAVYVDIVLRLRKEPSKISANQQPLFAQNVPPEALRLYKSGVKSLNDKQIEKGRADLAAAIKIFPTYYDALDSLGCSYVETKEFMRSLPFLLGAIDVNQRSFSSYYALAYAAYKLNQIPDAVKAAAAAVTLNSGSFNAQLLHGTVLRMDGQYDKALESLTKAEKLSKNAPVAEVHYQLAMTLNRLKRDSEAAKHLETYLRLAPDAPNRAQIEDLIRKLKNPAKPSTFS